MRIGIDLGGTKTEGVLLGANDDVVLRRRVPTPGGEGYGAIVETIVSLVRTLDAEAGRSCFVGVGIPGIVARRTGRVKNANTTCLIGRPLAADLEARLARVVRVTNDANCFAVAEIRAGAARGADVAFGVILGTGVGGGLVLDGVARDGLQGIAGEWGHSPIEDRHVDAAPAPRCYCGQHGCIETRLSGPAFEADHARLAGIAEAVPAPEIVTRAERGDPPAVRAFERYLGFFGEGIARLIHVLDPDVIVLGGGMSNLDALYTRGAAEVEAVLFNDRLETPIVKNHLGDSAGVFGAAWLWPDEAEA